MQTMLQMQAMLPMQAMQITPAMQIMQAAAQTAPATQAMLRILKTRLLTRLTAGTQTAIQNNNGNRSSVE